jgi:hypothetical protein
VVGSEPLAKLQMWDAWCGGTLLLGRGVRQGWKAGSLGGLRLLPMHACKCQLSLGALQRCATQPWAPRLFCHAVTLQEERSAAGLPPFKQPPVAVVPLGTGNDLARVLGWGGGYGVWRTHGAGGMLTEVLHATPAMLDRWSVEIEPAKQAQQVGEAVWRTSSLLGKRGGRGCTRLAV